MNRKQQRLYDDTCTKIREEYGSYNSIAVRSAQLTDEIVTGETIRLWFTERKIPPEFVFVLYEMMTKRFDPLTLLPWLRRWVILK